MDRKQKEYTQKAYGSYISLPTDASEETIKETKELLLEQITMTLKELDPFIIKGPDDYLAEGGFNPGNQLVQPADMPEMKDRMTVGWKIYIDVPRE